MKFLQNTSNARDRSKLLNNARLTGSQIEESDWKSKDRSRTTTLKLQNFSEESKAVYLSSTNDRGVIMGDLRLFNFEYLRNTTGRPGKMRHHLCLNGRRDHWNEKGKVLGEEFGDDLWTANTNDRSS